MRLRLKVTSEEARQRHLRTRILRQLARHGEMPTTMLVSSLTGLSYAYRRPDVERALADLCVEGIVDCERRTAPIYHGSRHGREWTYWRLADAPAGEGR